MIGMPERDDFYDHVRAQAEERVFVLASCFNDEPQLFVGAFGHPEIDDGATKDDALFALFEFCCHLVASEWTWTVRFHAEDIEVCAVDMR